ncbi:MAG: NlpC/P60 family protein [Lachnospiraceae bacterium]
MKGLKKLVVLTMALFMLCGMTVTAQAASPIKVTYDNKTITYEGRQHSITYNGKSTRLTSPGITIDGYVMIPYYEAFVSGETQMGREYDDNSKTLTLTYRGQKLVLRVGQKEATLDGKMFRLPVAPTIVTYEKTGSCILVPAKAVCKRLGIEYNFVKTSQTTGRVELKEKSTDQIRKEMVAYAKKFVGLKYVWGGTSLTSGADCSGFVQAIYKKYGVNIPRVSRAQAQGGKTISKSQLKKGDLIFYGYGSYINHVAMYIGDGKVINASNSAPYPIGGVKIVKYDYRKPVKMVSYLD